MTDTSHEPQPKVPRSGLVFVLAGLLVVVLGFASAYVFPDMFARLRPQNDPTPPINPKQDDIATPVPGNGQQRSTSPELIEITAETPTETQPVVIETVNVPPELSESDIRLAERARLAFESPLSPAVRDLHEVIKNQEIPADETPRDVASLPIADDPSDPAEVPDVTRSQTLYTLARGTVIPTVLESKIDSALPGLIRARVSETVYDSLTGRHVLIPRGARLVGQYAQATEAGAQRLFVTWDDLRMPDGRPVAFDDFSSLGADGAAGIRGRRSTGLFQAFGAAVLLDLAGNATQILTGQNTQEQNDLSALLAAATGTATSRVADRYLGQLLGTGTRFRVNAGAIMNVLVEKDVDLPVAEPWS